MKVFYWIVGIIALLTLLSFWRFKYLCTPRMVGDVVIDDQRCKSGASWDVRLWKRIFDQDQGPTYVIDGKEVDKQTYQNYYNCTNC